MQETITALLVHPGESCFQALELILADQGIPTRLARNCAEASVSLAQPDSPKLVFTGIGFCDGTWADVLRLASEPKVHNHTAVIVVSRLPDHQLYFDVMEGGAIDFIVPPFQPDDVAFVVRSAIWNARHRASRAALDLSGPTQQWPPGAAGGPPSHDA